MSQLKKKATVMVRSLAEKATVRYSPDSKVVTQGVDASGNPTLTINDGSPAAGEQNIFLRVLESPSIGVNSIGQTQDSYGPNIVQIAMEDSAVAGTTLVSLKNIMRLVGDVFTMGCRVEFYEETTGTAPTVTSIAAGKLVYTWDDLYFPFMKAS